MKSRIGIGVLVVLLVASCAWATVGCVLHVHLFERTAPVTTQPVTGVGDDNALTTKYLMERLADMETTR